MNRNEAIEQAAQEYAYFLNGVPCASLDCIQNMIHDALALPPNTTEPVALVSEEFGSDTHYIEVVKSGTCLPRGTPLYTRPIDTSERDELVARIDAWNRNQTDWTQVLLTDIKKFLEAL
jgi:hypothetical protein